MFLIFWDLQMFEVNLQITWYQFGIFTTSYSRLTFELKKSLSSDFEWLANSESRLAITENMLAPVWSFYNYMGGFTLELKMFLGGVITHNDLQMFKVNYNFLQITEKMLAPVWSFYNLGGPTLLGSVIKSGKILSYKYFAINLQILFIV